MDIKSEIKSSGLMESEDFEKNKKILESIPTLILDLIKIPGRGSKEEEKQDALEFFEHFKQTTSRIIFGSQPQYWEDYQKDSTSDL